MTTELDLAGLAIVVIAALLCGILMARLRQAPLVGYIVAGVLLGPAGAGLVADREPIRELAELGVIALLFVVGMRLDLRDFEAVYRTAVLGTLLQFLVSIAVLGALAPLLDWPLPLAVFLGFVVSLSSTAVGIRMLEDIGEHSETGRCVVGILIAQDLAFVPILIVVNGMPGAGETGIDTLEHLALAAICLGLAMWYLRRRGGAEMALPFGHWIRRHRDLAPLAALAWCFAGAALSTLSGLSPALGAFLAGLYLGNTDERQLLTAAMLPIESVLVMAFFLSIGLLLDVGVLWAELWTILLLLLGVLVTNSAINVLALRVVGEPWPRAVIAGFALAQIGEFSFILTRAGVTGGLLDEATSELVISVIALGLIISPLWLDLARRLGAGR